MTQKAIIEIIPSQRMRGSLRKQLTVPEGHLALLVQGRAVVGRRGAGEHHLGNFPKPAPDAVLLPEATFDLRPRIRGLHSGDGQELDLLWPITLQIGDAARFYRAWLAPAASPDLALVALEDHIAGRLWERAAALVKQYELADLRLEEQVQAGLGKALEPALGALLSELGLALSGGGRAEPRTVEEERDLLRALGQTERAARDARFEALFERLEDRAMLEHRLAEWAAERGEAAPDAALVDRMWQVVETGPEEAAARAQRAADVVGKEVDALERTVEAERSQNERRFHQLQARLEAAERAALKGGDKDDQIPVLKQVRFVVRVLAGGLSILAGLVAYFAPHLTKPSNDLQFWATIMSALSGGLAVLSEVLIHTRVGRILRERELEKRTAGVVTLEERRTADRLVRARVEAALKQVASSLEAAWRKGFGEGGASRELAVDLRQVAHQVGRFQEQDVRAANYLAGRYLAREEVPDAELGAMLDLDDDLLARGQALARSAEGLYRQVNGGLVDDARASLREMENELNELRGRFIERGAYLMG